MMPNRTTPENISDNGADRGFSSYLATFFPDEPQSLAAYYGSPIESEDLFLGSEIDPDSRAESSVLSHTNRSGDQSNGPSQPPLALVDQGSTITMRNKRDHEQRAQTPAGRFSGLTDPQIEESITLQLIKRMHLRGKYVRCATCRQSMFFPCDTTGNCGDKYHLQHQKVAREFVRSNLTKWGHPPGTLPEDWHLYAWLKSQEKDTRTGSGSVKQAYENWKRFKLRV